MRVFISSTFRDMQLEREELVKQVFSRLRKLCESRGVSWSEVDLRWGVTDEQRAEGRVLSICLAEIHRSRPYFIGLLGERYGWRPEELPAQGIGSSKALSRRRSRPTCAPGGEAGGCSPAVTGKDPGGRDRQRGSERGAAAENLALGRVPYSIDAY